MPQTTWETLFEKCVSDVEYRTALASALADNNDTQVASLLDQIGVGGEGLEQRTERLTALKAAHGPLLLVTEVFSGLSDAAAP